MGKRLQANNTNPGAVIEARWNTILHGFAENNLRAITYKAKKGETFVMRSKLAGLEGETLFVSPVKEPDTGLNISKSNWIDFLKNQ